MKNMFNVKVFQKIQGDDIVIKEETEIRNLGKNFAKMYKKLVSQGIFGNEKLTSTLGNTPGLKSKDIQKKSSNPEKFLEDVQEIHDKFISENLEELELNP